MGPFTTKEKGKFLIDPADEAVRGALVLEEGKLMWPAPPPKVTKPHFGRKYHFDDSWMTASGGNGGSSGDQGRGAQWPTR